MKFCLTALSFLIIICQAFAQTTQLGSAQGQGYMNNGAGGVLTEIKAPERQVVGSTYVNDEWLLGRIDMLNGQIIDNVFVRYDILADQVEVKTDGFLRGAKGRDVKSLTFFHTLTQSKDVFVNVSQYAEEGVRHAGLYKVIASGEWSLLEKTEIVYVNPSFNAALNVGTEARYDRKSKLYIAHGSSIFVASRNKKDFLESFNEPEVLSSFIKKKNLSLRETEDVKVIVDFLNTRS